MFIFILVFGYLGNYLGINIDLHNKTQVIFVKNGFNYK